MTRDDLMKRRADLFSQKAAATQKQREAQEALTAATRLLDVIDGALQENSMTFSQLTQEQIAANLAPFGQAAAAEV